MCACVHRQICGRTDGERERERKMIKGANYKLYNHDYRYYFAVRAYKFVVDEPRVGRRHSPESDAYTDVDVNKLKTSLIYFDCRFL